MEETNASNSDTSFMKIIGTSATETDAFVIDTHDYPAV